MITLTRTALVAFLLAGSAGAAENDVFYVAQGPEGEAFAHFEGAKALWSFEGHVVKGAPYSAKATLEIVQTLADGNRIVKKTVTGVYRDGQGRTRREVSLGAIGPFVASQGSSPRIFINDPVAGTNYVLSPDVKEATRLPPPPEHEGKQGRHEEHEGKHDEREKFEKHEGQKQTENLGKQTFEGVEAEGTRTTVTIPAGTIGNEQAIEIVSERWYSPALQTVVLKKRTDPRFGETTYRLQGIAIGEPDKTLFQVPADYQVKDAPAGKRFFINKPHEPNE
jgi:hypothetical protein